MVTINDIEDAIAERIEATFPGEILYRGYAPYDHKSPSNLLQQTDWKAFPNLGCNLIELRPSFTISTCVTPDAFDHGDPIELTRRQMVLLGLFLPGYIRVKDRAPKVLDEIKLENDLDQASVTVTLSYTLSREEFIELHRQPDMGTLHIRQEVTTHG